MEKLRTTACYNPFFVWVNDKSYEVNALRFYKPDGTWVGTRSGWFQSRLSTNNKFKNEEFEIPDVVLRKKEKFDGATFAIRTKNYEKTVVILYIPFEFMDFEVNEIVENRGWYDMHHNEYTSRKYPNAKFADWSNQWNVVNDEKKVKAVLTFNALVDALKEVARLEKECKELDPWNTLKYEYEILGLLKQE